MSVYRYCPVAWGHVGTVTEHGCMQVLSCSMGSCRNCNGAWVYAGSPVAWGHVETVTEHGCVYEPVYIVHRHIHTLSCSTRNLVLNTYSISLVRLL